MKKIVYFLPKINKPAMGGGDVHSFEILENLKILGYKLYLFILERDSYPIVQKNNWGFEETFFLRLPDGINEVEVPRIKEAFSNFIDRIRPDYIWMNYASCDKFLDHERHNRIKKIIYNHHFESVRLKMSALYSLTWNAVAPKNFDEVTPILYDLDFYKDQDLEPDPKEYETYDRYDLTFVIEDFGADLIRKNCKKTQVFSFPVTLFPRECSAKFEKVALFTMSSYHFNYQGYYFFTKKVLPLILKKQPLFFVRLIGIGSDYFYPTSNVFCKKFVLDLQKEYERASLSICPSFAGTGQQVKIIEAMHYGIPSVCMEVPMQYNPIKHKETGYIAKSAEEFAEYTLELYNNPTHAREMGALAQKVAREKYNHNILITSLKKIEGI